MNSDNILSHSVRLDTIQENDQRKDVESFLDAEYGKSLRSVSFERLNYLENSFHTPLNLFAKIDITNREEVPGIIGFLLEIEPEEVIEGFNDFSIITSSRIVVEWMMLGPISFINASCKPNVAYVKVRKLMVCVPFRDIIAGEELTVFYRKFYFGINNIELLCSHRIVHGNLFPEIPRKRRKQSNKALDFQTRFLRRGLPCRARIVFPKIFEEEINDSFLTYEAVFGSRDISESADATRCTRLAKRLFSSRAT